MIHRQKRRPHVAEPTLWTTPNRWACATICPWHRWN